MLATRAARAAGLGLVQHRLFLFLRCYTLEDLLHHVHLWSIRSEQFQALAGALFCEQTVTALAASGCM
ncbi:MAG: hypothetical protein JO352_00675 [Chloroflexi bacterium]|nr:hypothetical protein [Chloroflexota bacterium]